MAKMRDGLQPTSLEPIFRDAGIALAVLFGSRTTGKARDESDFDIGLLHGSQRPMTFRELADVHLELESRLPAPVDVVDLVAADPLLRMEVIREGQVLFCPDRQVWVDFVAKTLIEHADIAPFIEEMAIGTGRAARQGGA